ncbi:MULTISPECIES: cytochrome P450 [Actinoalloteichus]|nr:MULTISPECIES: cytochrome P450 [Actinoalloteichus]
MSERLMLDPLYSELRATESVCRVSLPFGEDGWLVTRFEYARVVLADPRFSRAASVDRDEPRLGRHQHNVGITTMDPPHHTRLRGLAAKALTARRVEELRLKTRETAQRLVEDLVRHDPPVDLVEHFALPFPIAVICELMGVPPEDRGRLRSWAEVILSTTGASPEEVGRQRLAMHDYLTELVARRRREPTDDLLGAMVLARDGEDRLTDDEMVLLAGAILTAGHETIATQIPNFVYVLLTTPRLIDRVRAAPDLLESTVEELMRSVPLTTVLAARYALEDVRLGDVVIRAGDPVVVSLASANMDEEVFCGASEIDPGRKHNPHLGFGHGSHHCIGAQLARMELQVALETLLRRLPGLRLGVEEDALEWKSGMLVRGLRSLPVGW